ncbi:MAG TPA: hypothetical protein VJS86_02405, partial [Arthrobacter sp.]|nr:hypothetical protein [Arthrobacter sp.]
AGTDMYVVSVEECSVQWEGTSGLNENLSCPSGSTPRIPSTTLATLRQDVQIPLNELSAGTTSFLRFTLARPAGPAEAGGTSLTLGIGVSATGEDTGGAGFPDPEPSPGPSHSPAPGQSQGPGQSPSPGHLGDPSQPPAPGQSGDASPPMNASQTNTSPGDTGLGETGAAVQPALFAGGALLLLGAAVVVAFRGPRPSARTTR